MINVELQDKLYTLHRLLSDNPTDRQCLVELKEFIADNAGLVDLNELLYKCVRNPQAVTAECFLKHGADPLTQAKVGGVPMTALFHALEEGHCYNRIGYHPDGTVQAGRVIAQMYIDAAIRLHAGNTKEIVQAFTEKPHHNNPFPEIATRSVLNLATKTGMLSIIFDLSKWTKNPSAFGVLWQHLPESERKKIELHHTYDQLARACITPQDKKFLPEPPPIEHKRTK